MQTFSVDVSCLELDAPDLPKALAPLAPCKIKADSYGSAVQGVVAHIFRLLAVDFHGYDLRETTVGLFCLDGNMSESIYSLVWRSDGCHPDVRPRNCPDLRIRIAGA